MSLCLQQLSLTNGLDLSAPPPASFEPRHHYHSSLSHSVPLTPRLGGIINIIGLYDIDGHQGGKLGKMVTRHRKIIIMTMVDIIVSVTHSEL